MKKKKPRGWLWLLIKENLSFLVVIVATLFALACIVTLTFGSFYKSSRESAITIGTMTVSQEARRIEDSLSAGLNTLLVSSYTVDEMMERDADAKAVEEYLIHETDGIIAGINPDFSGIYGVINDVYVDGIGWQPEPGYVPYERPWYLAAAESAGELAIVSPYVDAQTHQVMVSVSKLLSDGKSAISLDLALDNIYEATETISLNGKGYCFLLDDKGQVVAHKDHAEIGKNYLTGADAQQADVHALTQQIYAGSDQARVLNVQLSGKKCMVFTQSVQDEWRIVLVVENDDLFKESRRSLINNIVISLAIFLIVGYFCTSNYNNRKRAIRYAEGIRTDDLTGLNNRGEFDRYLHTVVSSITTSQTLYLMLFDADDFKTINDRFGHQEGDRALRLIAKTLMNVCHGTDWFCARYGGDEFVIICKCDDAATVERVIARIAVELDAVVAEENLPYQLSLSCGYASYGADTASLTDWVDKADQDLYRKKAERRGR